MLLHTKLAAFLALGLGSIPSHALTYWIDPTCEAKPGWSDIFRETMDMASKSHARLSSATDTDFAAVFKRIFKDDVSVTASVDQVKNIMGGIADWTPAPTRPSSNLRIYCDNDKRWVARSAGGFTDSSNLMLYPQSWGSPGGCRPGLGLSGETYSIRAPEPAPVKGKASALAGQEPNRATMTICDHAFTFPEKLQLPAKMKDLPLNKDLTKLNGVGDLELLISLTMLHEWTHHPEYRLTDVGGASNAYGWDNILKKNAADSRQNSDNYAYLGAWALLADRGYTLPRLGNPVDPQADQDAKDGKLRLYNNITKRWLKGVARYFRA
ncbi:MAG: hypothetical protein M1817_000285 [Caeruleum heppii]|nr:MAG: hypothetical protein M1817_000285 [Caeruleum heppii]